MGFRGRYSSKLKKKKKEKYLNVVKSNIFYVEIYRII